MHYLVVLKQLNSINKLRHQYLSQILSNAPEFFSFGSASQLVYQRFEVTVVAQFENEYYRFLALLKWELVVKFF